MKKANLQWSVVDLTKKLDDIEFPEYQREPTVWNLDRKQKLVDSMLRGFDISCLYLNKRPDGIYECIDGRQRINAIVSYLGLNGEENSSAKTIESADNAFKFKSSDEVLDIKALVEFDNKRFDQLSDENANRFLSYSMNVVEIYLDEGDSNELLNLMFLRLQLGAHLNAGEKLKAMLGDMRDLIYLELGNHPYFSEVLSIPDRRFAKELTASQLALNFFSIEEKGEFKRARFADLQDFFKTYRVFDGMRRSIAEKLRTRLDGVTKAIGKNEIVLKNRAIGITTFFFINDLFEVGRDHDVPSFIEFLKKFVVLLKEQIAKGVDIEEKYRELLQFQNFISQAAVEKTAIENRQKLLSGYFETYVATGQIL